MWPSTDRGGVLLIDTTLLSLPLARGVSVSKEENHIIGVCGTDGFRGTRHINTGTAASQRHEAIAD